MDLKSFRAAEEETMKKGTAKSGFEKKAYREPMLKEIGHVNKITLGGLPFGNPDSDTGYQS